MNAEQSVHPDRRQGMRHTLRVPVHLDHGAGVTRDLSLHGAYFETDWPYTPHEPIWFEIAFEQPGARIQLRAAGQVLRVERIGDRHGVAVSIQELTMIPFEN
jgi:hypothetical protein